MIVAPHELSAGAPARLRRPGLLSRLARGLRRRWLRLRRARRIRLSAREMDARGIPRFDLRLANKI